jgi:hypothetical protein
MEDYLPIILIVALLLGAGFLYFIPTWIAWNKPNSDAVMIVNLLFGWTFLGWITALVMALWESDAKQIFINKQPKTDDNLDKIAKLKKLYDSGAINESEFLREKGRLLSGRYQPGSEIDL